MSCARAVPTLWPSVLTRQSRKARARRFRKPNRWLQSIRKSRNISTNTVTLAHEESEAHEKKEEEKKRQNSPEQKKKEQEEEKRKEELTKAETKAVAAIALSPILSQFKSIKEKHPDAMLLFRRGDFYETYMDDAEKSSRILGITLTKNSKEKDFDGKPLKIAGFPHHALDSYLPKLIRAGQRVAICDLLESPKQKVSEVVTPNKDPDSVPSQKQAVKAEEVQSHGLHR